MRGTVCTIALILTGCTTTGEIAPNLGERLAADVRCLAALSAAGVAVSRATQDGKPTSAITVLEKIDTIGTSNIPVTTLAACTDTINAAVADGQGIRARVKDATVPDPKKIVK